MTASANRDRFRAIAHRHRNLPGRYGLRPYTVTVRVEAWDGADVGQGTETVTDTEITERGGYAPKVRWLSDEEIALQGENPAEIEVGPITPSFSGGGTAIATLTHSAAANNQIVKWILTGPEFPTGAAFRVVGFKSDRALHYTATLKRVAD